MTEYKVTLFRNDSPIFDTEITADAVVEIMRAIHAGEENDVPPPVVKKTPKTYKKSGKVRTCGACGKPGHRRDNCGKEEPAEISTDPLSEAEFRSVKECKDDGMASKATADELELNMREVNIAFGSYDYDNYLKSRT